ncbi:hypothetical protein FNJ87_16340 [Nonlabens mediterrranea]|uniref:OmpA-like domain-containing protein n=2 Tax=Nonlabens mediterrranea TaxID=1419947 RepID=A0ABS0A9L9_9FLAO|nr:hypothetical protein [Nonlabens mediterrranea]
MKNFFTGALAFIVYAGICLALFGYFFIGRLSINDKTEKDSVIVTNEQVIDELISEEKDTIPTNVSSLDQQLDSIAASKALINDMNIGADSIVNLNDENRDLQISEKILEDIPEDINNNEPIIYEANTFVITDRNGKQLTNCSTFTTIYKNNPKVKIPYPCRAYGNELKEILVANPKAEIIISGYSSLIEDSNMGMKRAEYVKQLLTNIGINKDQIAVRSDSKEIPFKSGIAQGGLDIQVLNIEEKVSNNSSTKTPVTTNKKPTLDKGTGPYAYQRFTKGYQGDFFYGNRAFTAYIKEIQNYLKENNNKKVYIYAYTDTVGNATDNYNIGRDNVKTARSLMIQNGIGSNQIVTIPKGEESSGAAGNNRSIVVIVK